MGIIPEPPEGREVFHAGEREAQRRFGEEDLAREMKDIIADRLSEDNACFMASQPFFFVSAREPDGRIFAQMLACAETAQGVYPLLAFESARTFYFLLGEVEGARLVAVAGDAGCKAGLIFIDFARRARFRVNGSLRIAPDGALPEFQRPAGYRLMEVGVEQAYANCPARIVRLKAAIARS